MTQNHERPRTNKPLHGKERPKWWPLVGAVAVLAAVLVLFLVLTYVQQHT